MSVSATLPALTMRAVALRPSRAAAADTSPALRFKPAVGQPASVTVAARKTWRTSTSYRQGSASNVESAGPA